MSRSSGTVRKRARSLADSTVSASQTTGVRLTAAVAAVAGLGSLTATRVILNTPVGLPASASGVWFDAVATAAVVGPASAALLLGVTTEEAWTRIGLVLVGVFGLLSMASASAALAATGTVVVGGWLVLAGRVVATDQQTSRLASGVVVAISLLVGLTCSLFGAVGVEPGALRPAGTTLALAGMAATPLAFRPRTTAFAVGGFAAGLTFYLTGAAPFVSGAVVLIAGSVVGASALLLAVAVGGLTATVAEGAASRRIAPTAAGLLLLTAGVPSSIPRALGAVLAVGFVLAPTVTAERGDST